jgi:hypothetical protein
VSASARDAAIIVSRIVLIKQKMKNGGLLARRFGSAIAGFPLSRG